MKSLYKLQWRHNKAKAIVSTGCYPVDTIINQPSIDQLCLVDLKFNTHLVFDVRKVLLVDKYDVLSNKIW